MDIFVSHSDDSNLSIMNTLVIVIFAIGYLAIALEHTIKINKTAFALIVGVLCWTIYILLGENASIIHAELSKHLGSISEILFFLLGAMIIVELIDANHGFYFITKRITTQHGKLLLWIISILTFVLSAILDNLTSSIVMVSLLRKLVKNRVQRRLFACIVIIAANAGGAWTPIGDVTTTMLWIGGHISAIYTVKTILIPSIVSLVVPLLYLSTRMKDKLDIKTPVVKTGQDNIPKEGCKIMLFFGVGCLLFVPVFKTVTHLPPYMGMLLSLGIMWFVSEIIHINKCEADRKPYTVVHALTKIDSSSVLFFLGILVAIGALESMHLLDDLAHWMNDTITDLRVIVVVIGLASALIDNVPLVAATMGMYDLVNYPPDHLLWNFLTYCAGTGGSVLIIGSAAGVAIMGMEGIDFMWYLKKISFIALIGYFSGVVAYLFQSMIIS
ncbi:MAG: sodium:proton antiporter NhaD [Bacteroidota bacterium]|nr:sodium:proton antiporter NhaD [Bacteroidota bacterium]